MAEPTQSLSPLKRKISGNVSLVNLITNGNFNTDDTWLGQLSTRTIDIVNHRGVFTATALYGQMYHTFNFIAGHKYYYSIRFKTNSASVFAILMYGASIALALRSPSVIGDYGLCSGVVAAPETTAGKFGVYDYRASGWDEIEFKECMVIDLTAAFGIGMEPSATDMQILLTVHFGDSNGFFLGTQVVVKYTGIVPNQETQLLFDATNNTADLYWMMSRNKIGACFIQEFGPNSLMMLRGFGWNAGTIITPFDMDHIAAQTIRGGSDWIGPYVMEAASGDGAGPGWVGGNHGKGDAATAATVGYNIYIDGKKISTTGQYSGEEIKVIVHNRIMAYNTVSLERNVLEEYVTYTFKNGKLSVEVRFVALESLAITTYYGLQVSDASKFSKIHFIGGSTDTVQDYATDLVSGTPYYSNWVDAVALANDDVTLTALLDRSVGISDRSLIASSNDCFFTSLVKLYANLIRTSLAMTAGQHKEWRGEYVFRET